MGHAMSSKERTPRACIEAYFSGMAKSSRALLERAFHPDARIVGPDDGELKVMDREAFIELALRQDPVEELPAEVLSVAVDGDVATARVRDTYLGRVFVDHLALVRLDDEWRIYTKLWHMERRL